MDTVKTLDALINLTDESDELLYNEIADKIMSFGINALPTLTKVLTKTFDTNQHNRIENLIYNIEHQNVIDKLKSWRNQRPFDLLEPYMILCRHRYPNINWSVFTFQIMMMVEQAEQELNTHLTPLEQVKVINHIIYDVNRIQGEALTIKNPNFYYINTLFETRLGNPLSIGFLYIIIAQKLNIPIYGIVIPKHFILAFTEKTSDIPTLENVLFYINPYNKGIVFTKNDIRKYLNELNIKPRLCYFEPSGNVKIFERMLRTLIETYASGGNKNQADELKELLEK